MSVNPKPQTIDSVFANVRYYISFYQREYKWKKMHIESLLDDIFYKFKREANKPKRNLQKKLTQLKKEKQL